MKLVVVRHYKTKSNTHELIMGWSDAPPEDDYAKDLYFVQDVLSQSKLQFDTVWSSDLGRATKTAKFFAKLNKISSHVKTDKLNEVNYGALTNKSKKWAEKNFPKHKNDANFVYPNGESFKQMQTRSIKFIDKRITKNKKSCNLLVVHAGVIRGLICHYLELAYSDNLKRRIGHRYVGVFEIVGKGFVRYDELGENSDFVANNIINIPTKKRITG